jgi:hypothetical protein
MNKENELNERIRRRAYKLWQEEGCPTGREEVHWDMATELVAIEDNQMLTTSPVEASSETGSSGDPIEPAEVVKNLGEFPTATTDQGEQSYPPQRPTPESIPATSVRPGGSRKAGDKPGVPDR